MFRIANMLAGFVFLACGASTSHAQSPTPTPKGPFPVDHFTKYGQFGGVALSPSGEHLAYFTGKNGSTVIAIISVKDKKLVGGARCPDDFEFYDVDWVSDKRLVYQLAERQPGDAFATPTGELGAMDIDGKNQRLIYGYRAGEKQLGTHMKVREASYATPVMISASPNDEKNILIAEHPWKDGGNVWRYDSDAKPLITRLNVFTGDKRVVDRAPLANARMLADKDDQVRFAFGRNDVLKWAVSWKPDPKGAWVAFELPGFDAESMYPLLLSDDNQSVFFTAIRTNESLVALFKLSLATKEVTKVYAFENTDVTGVIRDFARKNIIGVSSYVDKPKIHWLNETDNAARLQLSLARAFPGHTIYVPSATLDGKIAIVLTSSDVNPGDYYLFDTTTMKADYLNSMQKWIDPATMQPKAPFTFKARDGLELHGYLTRPAGEPPYPLVVLPHGGPGVRDYWDFDWEVQLLANRGYAVLQVNYRGSAGYGDEFERMGYGNWGAVMQDDVTDATRWAIDQKIAAIDRICIYGASYGGYAALQGAVREPSLYRCAVGNAGVYDLELMFSSADIPHSKSGRAELKEMLGTDRGRLREFSPVYHADKIQIPVLLVHGKEDWRADFEQAKRMKAALTKANKKVEWMALSREGHGVFDEETRREVYDRILAFLDANLKSTGASK